MQLSTGKVFNSKAETNNIEFTYNKKEIASDKWQILIIVKSTENAIREIQYPNGDILKCNGKNQIGIDYTIDAGVEYIFKIKSEDGNIKEERIFEKKLNLEELTIGTAQNTDKYGWKVTNYNVKEDETGCWRLFYQDSNYTYLISDNYIKIDSPYNHIENYPNGASVNMIGQKLNPMISTSFTDTKFENKIRIIGWFTDNSYNSIWTKYKNEDAIFAIRKSNSRIIYRIIEVINQILFN